MGFFSKRREEYAEKHREKVERDIQKRQEQLRKEKEETDKMLEMSLSEQWRYTIKKPKTIGMILLIIVGIALLVLKFTIF